MEIKIGDATIVINNIKYGEENGKFVKLSGKMDRGTETNKLVQTTMNSYINDIEVTIKIGNKTFSKVISGDFEEQETDLVYTILFRI